MQTSEKIGEIAKALSAAQGEFVNPERNRTVSVKMKSGGSYTFDYATFDAILAATRPILAKNGLAVIQGVSTKDRLVTVTTRVVHSSGEWLEDEIAGDAEGNDIQAIGSTCTYLKRYSYTAMLNIAAEEDDDGVAASGHDAEKFDRKDLPQCPKCATNKSVIVGKPEFGGGFVCFAKKGGCGNKWSDAPADEVAPMNDDRRPVKSKKEAPPKEEAPAAGVDNAKFTAVLASTEGVTAIKSLIGKLEAKPATPVEKQIPFRLAFDKLLACKLPKETAQWARDSVCEKRKAEMLTQDDYLSLVERLDVMLDKAAAAA